MALVPQLRWELPRLSVAGSTPCPATLKRHFLVEKSTSEEANRKKKKKKKRGKKCLSDAKSCCTRATCALGIKNTVRGRRRGAEASPASAAFGRAWSLFKLLGSKQSQRGFIIIIFLLLFFHFFFFFPSANDSLCGVGRRREKGSWGEPSRPLLPSAAGGGMLPPKGGYGTRTPAQVMLLTQKSPNIPAHNGHTVNMSFPIM